MANNSIHFSTKTYNQISSQIIGRKKTKTFDVLNLDQSLGQAHKCGVVKPVIGIQPSILDNWRSERGSDTQMWSC